MSFTNSFTNSNKLTVSQLGPSYCITQTSGCHFGTNEQLSTRIILSWFLTHSLHRPKKKHFIVGVYNDSVPWQRKLVTFRFSTEFSWKDSSLMVSFILIFLCHHPTSKPRNCVLRELNRQGQQTSLLLGFWHQILRKSCRVGRTQEKQKQNKQDLLTILEKKQGKTRPLFFVADWLSSTNQV